MIYSVPKDKLIEEITKWKSQYRDGKVSEKSLNKMRSANIVKSDRDLAAGKGFTYSSWSRFRYI